MSTLKTMYAAHAPTSPSTVYSDNAHETKCSKPTERLAKHQPTLLDLLNAILKRSIPGTSLLHLVHDRVWPPLDQTVDRDVRRSNRRNLN